MFHVEHAPGQVELEHFGQGREPDWRVERRPDRTLYWVVTDWAGELVAHGVRDTVGEAVTEAVRWAT